MIKLKRADHDLLGAPALIAAVELIRQTRTIIENSFQLLASKNLIQESDIILLRRSKAELHAVEARLLSELEITDDRS